jgi:CheY-like chemotaxis protein
VIALPVKICHDTLLSRKAVDSSKLSLFVVEQAQAEKGQDSNDRRSTRGSGREIGARCGLFVAKQILVIDDKSELLHLMRRVLEDEEYQVSILQDGRDAFTQVKAQLPDLLILDLKLGDVSGQDVLKELKHDPVTAEIPVIVYTAAVLEAEEVSELVNSDPARYQGVRVVQKPFELEDLLDLVGNLLSKSIS